MHVLKKREIITCKSLLLIQGSEAEMDSAAA